MQQDYDIVFTGRLRPGADPESALDAFSKRFDIGPDTARAILQAEQEIVIREGGTYRTPLLPGFELPLDRLLAKADDYSKSD